jgi:ankyrin repeat protein
MKTQMNISMKVLSIAIMVATVLTNSACGSKQKNTTGDKKLPAREQSSIMPPNIDIYSAALFGDVNAISQHIKAGTDLDEKDDYGSTPLIIAATFGKTEVARLLIDAGTDVNIKNNDGATALHSAAFLCRIDIVKALLENGIDKNIRNNFGSTALESVKGPFEEVKVIYDQFSKDLGPLGLKLDYEYLKKTRPIIAEMLH